MAGLIKINEQEFWSVASWTYHHVLRQSLPFIPQNHELLLSTLKKGMTEGELDYIDLRCVSTAEKYVLLEALKNGLMQTEKEGSESFADPGFYLGFIDRFHELIDMISSDLNESKDNTEQTNNGEI